MNLHGLASAAVGVVNPLITVSIRVSTGNTDQADGSRVPSYAAAVSRQAQMQPISGSDLRHLDALNLQGEFVGFYINGQVDGLIRSESKGGDLITTPDGKVYLVTQVLESWPDWCKVAATLQNA